MPRFKPNDVSTVAMLAAALVSCCFAAFGAGLLLLPSTAGWVAMLLAVLVAGVGFAGLAKSSSRIVPEPAYAVPGAARGRFRLSRVRRASEPSMAAERSAPAPVSA